MFIGQVIEIDKRRWKGRIKISIHFIACDDATPSGSVPSEQTFFYKHLTLSGSLRSCVVRSFIPPGISKAERSPFGIDPEGITCL